MIPETPIDALEFSIILWNWLVDNPEEYKGNCPDIYVGDWSSECALCEYSGDTCELCPMVGYWPIHSGKRILSKCADDDSAYYMWEEHLFDHIYDRAFMALLLVEAFEERLHELEALG